MTSHFNRTPSILFIADVEKSHSLLSSQGIPLIEHLSREGYQIGMVSFETTDTLESESDRVIQERLGERVRFHPVRMDKWKWLKGWIRKLLWGTVEVMRVQKRYRYQILQARSFFPALIAWLSTARYGGKWIYDTRNFFWEEQVELGRNRNNILVRWGFGMDRFLLRKAHRIIAVTEAAKKIYIKQLERFDITPEKIVVVHNSYSPERFGFDSEQRIAARRKLGIEHRTVLVYSGSLVQWYLFKEMAQFCNRFQSQYPQGLALWCSYEWTEESKRWAENLLEGDFRLMKLSPSEVGAVLQAADAGLMFLQLTTSNMTTLPIKFAEYLACGLPVVLNAGLIEPEKVVRKYRVGVVLQDMSEDSIQRGADERIQLVQDPEVKHRAQEAARVEFHLDQAIERYRQCYQTLIS